MPLCRHSVGTFQKTSSHATRQGTLDHSRLSSLSHSGLTDLGVESGISVHKLISTLKKQQQQNPHTRLKKKKKKRRQGINGPTFSKDPCKGGKTHHQTCY